MISREVDLKMSPLVLCKVLGLSVNTLTSDGKYPVQGCEILQLQFKCNYLINEKILLHFLFHFWILQQISKTLKEKMTVIANVFPKLQTVKRFVRKLSQEHRFRTGFGSQYVKDSQMLAQFPWERFYHIFLSLSVKLIWEMSPLVSAEMLGLSFNTLTSDGKYPVAVCESLQLPIQMQLSEKWKAFSKFFALILDSTSNFEHFERKDDRHS